MVTGAGFSGVPADMALSEVETEGEHRQARIGPTIRVRRARGFMGGQCSAGREGGEVKNRLGQACKWSSIMGKGLRDYA